MYDYLSWANAKYQLALTCIIYKVIEFGEYSVYYTEPFIMVSMILLVYLTLFISSMKQAWVQ